MPRRSAEASRNTVPFPQGWRYRPCSWGFPAVRTALVSWHRPCFRFHAKARVTFSDWQIPIAGIECWPMSRQLSRGEVAFILGVPAAWAILLLFHPGGEADTIYLNLQDKVDRFLVVHIGML